MKFTVNTGALNESLKKVLSIVSTRSTLPILSNIFISAKDGELVLTTTDLEVSVTTALDAEIYSDGSITLPARKFGQMVSALSGETVTLDVDENLCSRIASGSAKFKLMGMDSAEFPMPEDLVAENEFGLDRSDFGKTLRKIAYAVSTDQTRYVLNGILLSLHEGNFTAVATDGRRLALVEKNLEGGANAVDMEVILPIKVVNELQRCLEGEGEVLIKLTDSQASFTVDKTVILTKLLEGNYPNYRQVIPAEFSNTVDIPREAFQRVLNRVAIVLTEAGASVKFKLSENNLALNATSSESEADESLEVNFQGSELDISFNPAYLRDPLRNLECDDVTLRFNDGFKPIVLLGDEGFLCVIMPMRK
jgi:DNA polymerase-3 subunit beta